MTMVREMSSDEALMGVIWPVKLGDFGYPKPLSMPLNRMVLRASEGHSILPTKPHARSNMHPRSSQSIRYLPNAGTRVFHSKDHGVQRLSSEMPCPPHPTGGSVQISPGSLLSLCRYAP
jgi:hypothetical protein